VIVIVATLGIAGGDDDVSVVHEPVDRGVGDGLRMSSSNPAG
jgi:hypothetical protein